MRRSLLLALGLVGLAWTWQACVTGPSAIGGFLTGPETFTLGDVAPFNFVVTNNNGSRENVSAKSTWTSSDSSILAIDTTGHATGRAPGVVTVSAAYRGVEKSLPVAVATSNTAFRLLGSVTDSGQGLHGAQITARFGTATLSTTSSFDGSFQLFPVGGTAQITVALGGFTTVTQSIDVTNNSTVSFAMTPVVPPADISGAWQLTMLAPATCGTLPTDARQLSIPLTIAQHDAVLEVSVASDAVPTQPYLLEGQVLDHSFSINFFPDSYYGPVLGVLLKQIGPSRWLLAFGPTTGTVNGASITGTTVSTWDYFEMAADLPALPPKATCAGPATTTLQRTSTAAVRRR